MNTKLQDTAEAAMAVLELEGDIDLVAKVKHELERKKLEWVPDPDHTLVWGLRLVATDKIVCVVYIDLSDFEVNDRWMYGR